MTAAVAPAAVTCSRDVHWWEFHVNASTRCMCRAIKWEHRLETAAERRARHRHAAAPRQRKAVR